MSKGPNKKKNKGGMARCSTVYHRHFSEGIVDLDKGYEKYPLITVYKLEDVLPKLDHFLPPVRQSGHWLTLVTKGAGEKTIGDHHFEIRDNTLFLVGKRAVQSSRYYFPKVNGYTVIFDAEKLSKLLYKGTIIRDRKVLKGLLLPFLYLNIEDANRLAAIMEAIYRERDAGEEKVTELMALKIAELLIICDRLFERSRLIPKVGLRQPTLEKLLSLVDEHVHQQHSAGFYRDQLEMQGRKLNSILREHALGTTSDIIRNKLITDMKLLLTFTRLTIGSIANSLGFNSAQSCSRYFSRNMGISPSGFRANQNAVIRTMTP